MIKTFKDVKLHYSIPKTFNYVKSHPQGQNTKPDVTNIFQISLPWCENQEKSISSAKLVG